MTRTEMIRRAAAHDEDRTRVVLYDLARARLEIHDDAKRTAELERERDIRQAVYNAVRDVRTALAGNVTNAWDVVDEHVQQAGIKLRVAQAMLREQLGIVECSDCGADSSQVELRPVDGIGRGHVCESCSLRDEHEEGVGF